MDAWLGSGIEPGDMERRSILSRLTLCSITTASTEGALRTRTAMIERVGASAQVISVRLLGSGLYDDVVRNPRVVLSAVSSVGSYGFIVLNGLARVQSHAATGDDRELLVVEIAIQRMECWSADGVRAARKQVARATRAEALPRQRHEALALREA